MISETRMVIVVRLRRKRGLKHLVVSRIAIVVDGAIREGRLVEDEGEDDDEENSKLEKEDKGRVEVGGGVGDEKKEGRKGRKGRRKGKGKREEGATIGRKQTVTTVEGIRG